MPTKTRKTTPKAPATSQDNPALTRWTKWTAVGTLALTVSNVVLLLINLSWLSSAHTQLLASIDPNLQLSLRNDTLAIINAGLPDVSDAKIEEVLYLFDSQGVPRSRSSTNHPIHMIGRIASQASISIPMAKLVHPQLFSMASPGYTNYIALVVHFARDVDKRKYLLVRTFADGGTNGPFPLFHVPGIGMSIHLPSSYDVIQRIDAWERRLNGIEQTRQLAPID